MLIGVAGVELLKIDALIVPNSKILRIGLESINLACGEDDPIVVLRVKTCQWTRDI
jgi:hypothetical protein